MPRACPVEFSRLLLDRKQKTNRLDATGLPRGVSRLLLDRKQKTNRLDATGLPRGVSRLLLFSCEREPSTAHGRGIQSSFFRTAV